MVNDVLRASGQSHGHATGAFMEPKFEHDFSQIPVHPKTPARLQRKLTVNTPGDVYEQEADMVAEKVMRMATQATPHVQPQTEEEKLVQHETTGEAEIQTVPPIVDEVLRSPGHPLDADTRAFMEPRFGQDFSRVRVHSGAAAEQSARDVSANAYTVGHHIVFDSARFVPATHEGRRLIAHELTHVVQQAGSNGIRAGQSTEERGLSPTSLIHARYGALQRQPAAAPAGSQTVGALDEVGKAVRAAERARRDPNNQTAMMISGSEIVYRLIHAFLPDYASRISGVGYEEKLQGVRVEISNASISITVGSQFVLSTNEKTVERRALDLGAALFAKAPRQQGPQHGLLGAMKAESQRAPGAQVSFDEALKEGGEVLHAVGFGLTCGAQLGPDLNDRYDARDWKEKEGRREVLVAKIEPWLAFSNFLRNLREPVPSPSGGMTRWAFDCFGFVIVNRVYAHWRTLTRGEFNSHFTPFELGINARINAEWEKPIEAVRPGDKPFISGEVKPNASGEFVEERIPVGKTWDQVLETAPIGSQVTWGNQDAKDKCRINPGLGFCAYTYENSTKVGRNQYSAHPFGIVTREFIEDEMTKAVLREENKPTTEAAKKAYIKRFIYISGVRIPKKPTQSTTDA
jgi:hypothetical protein